MRLNRALSGITCFLFSVLVVVGWHPSRAIAQSSASVAPSMVPVLEIVVLEGEDGVNIIKKKTAVSPVVQVRDKNRGPGAAVVAGGIAGVVVLFVLPESGPTGVFANGARWTRVVTDANGRAVAGEIRPTGKGSFQVEIRASYQGQNVTRTIMQTNFSTIAAAHKAGKTPGNSRHDEVANDDAAKDGTATSAVASAAVEAGATRASTAAPASHHTLILGALAAGGAAAGAAAYLVTKKSSSSSDCSAITNQVESDVSNAQSVCGVSDVCSLSPPLPSQCFSATQQVLNDLGGLCQCAGPAAASQIGSLASQTCAQEEGLTWPAQCH